MLKKLINIFKKKDDNGVLIEMVLENDEILIHITITKNQLNQLKVLKGKEKVFGWIALSRYSAKIDDLQPTISIELESKEQK